LHEFGHAVVYSLQGSQVDLHFTKMDPINGALTLLGAAGGILSNAFFALLALFSFIRFGKIVFFLFAAGNTLFCRVLVGSLFLLSGKTMADEAFIAACLGMSPVLAQAVVVAALSAVFAASTTALFLKRGKRYSLQALGAILISSLASLVPLMYMDERQM
jgi:hypothetical protein